MCFHILIYISLGHIIDVWHNRMSQAQLVLFIELRFVRGQYIETNAFYFINRFGYFIINSA